MGRGVMSDPQPAAEPVMLSAEEHARLLEQVQQAESQKDQYLRSLAELENSKKRLSRDRDDAIRFAAQRFAQELLPVLDAISQALVAVDKQTDADAVVKGVHLIHRQLVGVLEKEGVKRIPTVGERFDPHRHEAVGQVDASEEYEDGVIVEEIQVGYTLHDKVLRPALVRVAKQNSDTQASG